MYRGILETPGESILSYIVSVKPDDEIHTDTLSEFMQLVSENIDSAINRARYNEIISVGCYGSHYQMKLPTLPAR